MRMTDVSEYAQQLVVSAVPGEYRQGIQRGLCGDRLTPVVHGSVAKILPLCSRIPRQVDLSRSGSFLYHRGYQQIRSEHILVGDIGGSVVVGEFVEQPPDERLPILMRLCK